MAETSALFLLSNYIAASDRLDEQAGITGDDAFHAHYAGASGPNQQRKGLGEIEDVTHSRRAVLRDTDLRPERQIQRSLAASRSRYARPQRAPPDGDASASSSASPSALATVATLGGHYDPPLAANRRPQSAVVGRMLTGRGTPGPHPTQAAAAAAASGERPPSPGLLGQQPAPAPLPLASSRTSAGGAASLWGDALLELGPAAATAATTAATAASLQDFLLMTAPYEPVSFEEHQRQKHAAAAAAAQQQLLSTGVIALPGQALSNVPPSTASAGAAPEPHSMRRRHGTSIGFVSRAKHPGGAGSGEGGVGGSARRLRRSVTALPVFHGGALLFARRSADGGRGAVDDSTAVTYGGLPSAASVPVRARPGPRLGSTGSPPSTPVSAAGPAALRPSQLQSAWPEPSAVPSSPPPPSTQHPPQEQQQQQQPVQAGSAPYGAANDAVAALPPGSLSLRPLRDRESQPGASLLAPSPAGSLRRRQRHRCDLEGSGGASRDGTTQDAAAAAAGAAAVAAAVVAPSGSAAAAGCGAWEAGGLVRHQSALLSTAPAAATAAGAPRGAGWRGWCWPRRLWGGGEDRTCGKCFTRARVVQSGQGHPSRAWLCDGVDPRVSGSTPWQVFRLDLWGAADKYLPLFVPSFGRSCWDAFLLVLLMYTAIVVPMEVGFRSVVTPAVNACNLVVLGIFWVDIFVQFRTAFLSTSGELVRDGRQIAVHYGRTWLPLDLASSIPWAELLMPLLEGSESRAGVLVALARLPRLLRLMRLLHQLDRYRYANVLRMVRLMVLLMLLGHWTACAWHAFAEWIPGWPWLFSELTIGASLLQQYSVALYFAYVLVVGSDNPQLPPQNNLERTFMIGVLVLGSIMSALVVSNMAMLVANYNSLSSRYVAKAALAVDALRYVGAPPQHRARVAEYYDFLTQNDHPGPDADTFLCELPRGLVEDIKWSLYGTAFNRLWLFSGCAEPFMAALQARLTLSAFTRGEVIYKDKDMGREMFIVRRGCVALRAPSGDLAALLRPGDVFGELALLPDLGARRRSHTAVALGSCDAICLAARDLAMVCKDHPDSGAMVQERLYQQYRHMLSGGSLLWFYDELTAQPETDADYDFDEWFQSGGLHLLRSVTSTTDGGGGAATDTEAPPQPTSGVDGNNCAGKDDGDTSTVSTPQHDAGNGCLILSTAAGTAGTTRSSSDDNAYTEADVDLFRTDGTGRVDALDFVSRDSSASSWASFFEAANATSSLSPPRVPPTPGFRNHAVQLTPHAARARGPRKSASAQRRNDGASTAAAAAAETLPPLPGAAVLDSDEAAAEGMAPPPSGRGAAAMAAVAVPLHMDSLSTTGSLLAAFAARRSGEFARQRSISVPRRRLEALLRSTSGREAMAPSRLATATGPAVAAVAVAEPPSAATEAASAASASAQTAAAAAAAVAAPKPPAAIDGQASIRDEVRRVERAGGREGGGESASNASRATGEASTVRSSSGRSSHLSGRGGERSGGGVPDDEGGILNPQPQSGPDTADARATGSGGAAVQPPPLPSPSPPSASANAGATGSGRPKARKHTTSTPASLPAPPPAPLPPPAAPPPPGQPALAARAGGRSLEGADGGSGGGAAATARSTTPASPEPPRRQVSGLRLSRPPPASPFAANLVLSSDEQGWVPPPQEGVGVERDQQPLQRQPSVQTPKRGLLGFASLLRRFNMAAEEPSNAGSGGGGGEGGGGGAGGSGGARDRVPEADSLRPAGSAPSNSAALFAAANASTASAFESVAEDRGGHGGGGQRRIRRFISGGSRNTRSGNATTSRLRGPSPGAPTLPGVGLSDRSQMHDTAMSTAPAWLIARASRDQWSRRPAVQQYDDLVGRALQTLIWALGADRDAVDTEGAGGGRRAGPLFELSAGQEAMLLSLVDWTVRRFGADAAPAVREAVQTRVRRVEQALSGAFKSVLSSLAQIEQTVASLNDSAAAAKSRLAAIEKAAAEAAGDGILAPNLLGLLDTDSGLNLSSALERLQQAGASGSSSWSDALLASALASYAGTAAAAAVPAAQPPAPPPPGAAAPSRIGSDALIRRRSSGILHHCSHSSALSDAPDGGADSAPSPTPSDRRASLRRRSSLSLRVSAGASSLANSTIGNGGGLAAATIATNAATAGDRTRRASSGPSLAQRLQQWRQATVVAALARRRSVDSTQQMIAQLRWGDMGMESTAKEQPSGSGSGVAGFDPGSLSGGSRRTSAERRRVSMDQRRSSEHRRSVPNASQGGAAVVLPASVDGKSGSDVPSATVPSALAPATASASAVTAAAAAAGNPAACANTSPGRQLPPVARSFNSGNVSSGAALQRPGPLQGAAMPLRSGGAARSAVLDDSVVRDGLGGGGSRPQQPTLLPSERPGARRALAPVLRTSENGPSPELPPAAAGNSAVRLMPYRRASTSALQPQLTMRSATSSAGGGGGGSMIAIASPPTAVSPVVAAQPHRTAAARAAAAAAAAAAGVNEADSGAPMGGGGLSGGGGGGGAGGSTTAAIRRKGSRGPLAGDGGDVSVRGGKQK